jgi:MYXO-CTERM domain-containing protein
VWQLVAQAALQGEQSTSAMVQAAMAQRMRWGQAALEHPAPIVVQSSSSSSSSSALVLLLGLGLAAFIVLSN